MAQDKEVIDQEEIERLLQQASMSPPTGPTPQASTDSPAQGGLDQAPIDLLLGTSQSAPTAEAGHLSQSPSSAHGAQPPQNSGQENAAKRPVQAGKAVLVQQAPAAKDQPLPPLLPAEGALAHEDVELLLQRAEEALASVDAQPDAPPAGVTAFRFPEFTGAAASNETATLDLIREVELDLKIELGRTHMYLEDVLKLRKGSVVPLDKLAGDPVDIYVNGRLIARGEVLVLNDNFCVRVAELVAGHAPAA